jgi:alanine or glycine:cation symporter, AGCS family
MYTSFIQFLDTCYAMVWGLPLVLLLCGLGLYLTIALRGIQFRFLFMGLKLAFGSDKEEKSKGDISNFQSLMTALAATIGIGNLAGVATAVASGGLGALFWMWVVALIGMSIKYAEAILAVKYRIVDARGEMSGGPMYFIERGLGWKKLAASFAFFGIFAAFGGGNMIQANSVADVMQKVFYIDPLLTAVGMALLCALTIVGGIKSIGKVAGYLVPFMALFYIAGAGYVLIQCYEKIPHAVMLIVTSAFSGQAALGGFMGASVQAAIQVGVSRGLMTSEAGLGTASIASAAAKTVTPAKQALVSMTGSFLATICLCTITALVLAVTEAFGYVGADGKLINGAAMTVHAFNSVISWGGYVVSIGLVLFAFTTLIGWAYYGEKCSEYLFGVKSIAYFRLLFIAVCFSGALLELEVVWKLSDIFNGLMAFPNLIGLCALSSVVIKETKTFTQSLKQKAFAPV